MEKNWIEEIKEFIRKAMNQGLRTRAFYNTFGDDCDGIYEISVFRDNSVIEFMIEPSRIRIETPKGEAYFDTNLTKRDLLELDAMILSIEEYNEDMAISEFKNFFNEETKIIDVNELNDDD
jgi:hypothetical protein